MAIPKKLIYRGKAKFMAGQKEAKIIKEYRFEASGTLFGYIIETPKGSMIIAKSFPDRNKTWGYA